jgi:regulator of sirC expression with transglutaminase-like and TPR domain
MKRFDADPQFRKLLSGCREVDLVHLMLELAADAYPQLDRVTCLVEIDRLGVAASDDETCRHASSVRARLECVSRLLYEVEGFHGDHEHYYEPHNSYLNEVLARRSGIPISLGILYMAVAARAGLKLFGVNTPGHFVIGCSAGGDVLYVDPFNQGEVLDLAACRWRIEQAAGSSEPIGDENFRPAAPREIVARVLRNLKAAYAMKDSWRDVLRVQERLAALLPQIAQERRDLGLIYLRLGQPTKALPALEQYLSTCGSDQAAELEPSMQAARRMIAELN